MALKKNAFSHLNTITLTMIRALLMMTQSIGVQQIQYFKTAMKKAIAKMVHKKTEKIIILF